MALSGSGTFYFLRFIFIIFNYVYVDMCTGLQCLQSSEKGVGCPGAGITGDC